LAKPAELVFDLGLLRKTSNSYGSALSEFRAARRPPELPEAFASDLRGKAFSVQEDLAFVVEKYREAFHRVAGFIEELDCSYLDWGDAEVQELSIVLPLYGRLRQLELRGNQIGAAGAVAIASVLPRCESLQTLTLQGNAIDASAGKLLEEAWLGAEKHWGGFHLGAQQPQPQRHLQQEHSQTTPRAAGVGQFPLANRPQAAHQLSGPQLNAFLARQAAFEARIDTAMRRLTEGLNEVAGNVGVAVAETPQIMQVGAEIRKSGRLSVLPTVQEDDSSAGSPTSQRSSTALRDTRIETAEVLSAAGSSGQGADTPKNPAGLSTYPREPPAPQQRKAVNHERIDSGGFTREHIQISATPRVSVHSESSDIVNSDDLLHPRDGAATDGATAALLAAAAEGYNQGPSSSMTPDVPPPEGRRRSSPSPPRRPPASLSMPPIPAELRTGSLRMEGFIPIGGSAAPVQRPTDQPRDSNSRSLPRDSLELAHGARQQLVPPTPRTMGYTAPRASAGVGAPPTPRGLRVSGESVASTTSVPPGAMWRQELATSQEVLPPELNSSLGVELATTPAERVEAFFASVESARVPHSRLSAVPEQ